MDGWSDWSNTFSGLGIFSVEKVQENLKGSRLVHTDCATATETQIFFPSRMGYIGPYGSVHMETCDKGKGNPKGTIQSILSVAVAAVSVNKPSKVKIWRSLFLRKSILFKIDKSNVILNCNGKLACRCYLRSNCTNPYCEKNNFVIVWENIPKRSRGKMVNIAAEVRYFVAGKRWEPCLSQRQRKDCLSCLEYYI